MGTSQRHEVPIDQRHLPRVDRQHPFRWLNEAEQIDVRREAGEAIAGVDRYIHQTLNVLGGRKFSRSDHEDAAQDIRLRLFTHALPAYNAWRQPRVKVSTFLCRCLSLHARDIMRSHRRRVRPGPITDALKEVLTAPDRSQDRLIEHLVISLLAEPERLGRHAHAVLSQPIGVSNAETAADLGISVRTLILARHAARKKAVAILNAAA